MQGAKVFQTDYCFEFLQEGLETCSGNEIVACCVAVAGVDTDADAGVVFLRN